MARSRRTLARPRAALIVDAGVRLLNRRTIRVGSLRTVADVTFAGWGSPPGPGGGGHVSTGTGCGRQIVSRTERPSPRAAGVAGEHANTAARTSAVGVRIGGTDR